MPGGVRLTPLDLNDIGSQLLQSLMAAEQTKQAREQLKLQEKAMGLQQKQLELEASRELKPPGQADVLSGL